MPAAVDHPNKVSSTEPIFPEQTEHAVLSSIERALIERRDGQAHLVGPDGERIDLPPSLFAVLRRAVHELRLGNGISILPIGAELTTREAAEILNVSRPFLIKLLEARKIPFRLVGAHRRVRVSDLLRYKARQDKKRREVLRELAEEAEEFGFYDDWPEGFAGSKEDHPMGKNQHVVPADKGWGVRGEGNSRLTSVHPTQAAAEAAARDIAQRERSEVLIHGRDGQIRARNSYGRDPHPPKG